MFISYSSMNNTVLLSISYRFKLLTKLKLASILIISSLFLSATSNKLLAQSCNANIIDPSCFPNGNGNIYDNVVIGEVSGDPGQSDGCNDGIVEIVGPPGTNIGCMVVSNSEWAVLIPPNTTIPADGVYLIACSQDPNADCGVGGIFSNGNGQACDDCDFPGLDGLSGPSGPPSDGSVTNNEIDLDVCDPDATTFYDPAATGFTIDNSNAGDGDQVMIFLPDGTPHDGIYWGLPNTTSGGATTVGGASGSADAVVIQIAGQTYTLGDNDQDGTVNNNPSSFFFATGPSTGLSGRGDRSTVTGATMVPVLPTNAACPCNTPTNPGTFTMPSLSDADFWFNMNTVADGGEGISETYKGCNSSFSRLDAGTSDGGSHGNPSHADGETTIGMTGVVEMFDPTAFTPSSCDTDHSDGNNLESQWTYTDHPTPGAPNDDPTFNFSTTAEILCDLNTPVSFTVKIYNYQHVSDNADTGSGMDNLQTGSLVNDPILGDGQTWMTYVVSGETTTMTYTINSFPAPGSYTFDLVWDDFSNCCGTQGNPGNQENPNECYETKSYTITVVEPLMALDNNIDCAAGDSPTGTVNVNNFISGGANLSFTLTDDAGTNAPITNNSGIFNISDDADSGPYTVTIMDGSGCSVDIVLTILDNCEEPPVCPTALVNTGTTANGPLCPGDIISLCLDGTDLPSGGQICWYEVPNSGATPNVLTDDLLGCVNIPTGATAAPTNTIPVINEILFDGPTDCDGGSGTSGEFIEIAVAPGTDLSCYILTDGDWEVLIPNGTVAPSDGFLLIANTSALANCSGGTPAWASNIDIDLATCGCGSGEGTILELTNSGEFVNLYDATGAFLHGIVYNSPSTTNAPTGTETIGATSAGCTPPTSVNLAPPSGYPIPDAEYTVSNGESIGLTTDGNANSGINIMSGIQANNPIVTPGMANNTPAPTPPDCFMLTLDETFCSGDIFINSLITGVPATCPAGSNIGIPSDFSMACPSADLVATAVDVCQTDQASVDVVVNLTGLGAADTYSIVYAIDGVPQTPITATGTTTTTNITINGPTTSEVKITLVSVQNTAVGGCTGTVDNDEACIAIRPTPTATVTASTDITACDGSGNGSVTFTFTGVGPFDFEYSINGGSPINVSSVNSPYTINTTTPGTYIVTAVSDENGCMGTVSGMQTVTNNTAGASVIAAVNPAAVCNDGTVSINLTDDAIVNLTPDYNATDFVFFAINPSTLTAAQQANPAFQITAVNNITMNQTVYVQYTDPNTGCVSSSPITITVNAAICSAVTCPVLGALSDPADICEGATFNITASGLDDMASAQNGDMNFGIAFQFFTGNTPPPDPYVGGTNLGTVAFANLTGTDPNQMADLMNIGSTLTAATYQICAILSPSPTDAACRPSQCITFVVNSTDNAGFTYPTTACINAATNPTATITGLAGGTFSVNNGATINAATGELTLSSTTAGTTYTVSYLTNGACPASSMQTIAIQATDNAGFTYPATACINATTNPTATITGLAGGTFSVNNGATINAATGELTLSSTTATVTYSITYTTSGACSASSMQMITIQRPDDADFTFPATACINAATNPTATITGNLGGTFSVNNGATINAATGELTLSSTTAGTTYTVSYLTNGACPASSMQTITIQATDNAGFTYPATACINATTNPTATITGLAGGTFSVNNGATINAATGELTLSSTTAGTTYTVSYLTNGTCPTSATQTIAIQAADNAGFTYPTTACINAATNPTATITGNLGGTFSVNNGATINAATGELTLSSTTAGTTYTVSYLINGTCPTSSMQTIAIQAADNAGFTYPTTACINATTNPTATITGLAGGTFSVNNGATINAATGELTLSSTTAGTTYTVSYLTNGTCPTSATQTIAIQAADNAGFDYPTTFCMNAPMNPTASNIATIGGTFTVDNGATINAATGELDLSTTAQNTVYTITYQTNGACPNSSSKMISIGMTDDASFTFPTTACINAATNPLATITGMPGGTFSVNNGATINGTTGELDLSTTTTSTTYTITYTTMGMCANSSTQTVAIQAADNASFTFPTSACVNATTNPMATITGIIGGTFSVNNGATINAATGELDLNSTTAGTTYTVSYLTNGTCPTSATQTIAIQAADNAGFDYPTTFCMNAPMNPTASNIATIGGTFTVNNGATINAATGELDLSSTAQNTVYTITYQTNGACPNSSSKMISIGMTDDASFMFPTMACMNAATNPLASITGMPGGTFAVNNGATINGTTGELDLSTTTGGTTYTVTYTTAGTCPNASTQTILINPAPNATIALAGLMNICNGNASTLNFFAGGGTADYTIFYEINDGTTTTTSTVTVGTSGMATVTVSPTQNTTYTILSVQNNQGCSALVSGSVSVNVLPNPMANPANLTVCQDGSNGVDFDLNTIINAVNGGATGVSVTFHATLTEAQTDMGALPLIYNIVPNATIFARVENNLTGCFSTSEITLNSYDCSIQINDPCACLDNASTAYNGQFTDKVIVTAPAGQTWYITTVTGLFDPMIDYPNTIPPGVQYPLTAFQTGAGGKLLVEVPSGVAGISNYYLQGVHLDGLGYSITVTNGTNSLSIPNGAISDTKCYYPDLFLTVDNALACSNGSPFNISFGEISGAAGIGNLFLNNAPYATTTIDPTALIPGIYTLRYDFDAGVATQGNAADPGCQQSIETTFEISAPNQILCRPPVNTIADAGLCGAVVQLLPPVILNTNVPVANVTNNAPATFPIGTTQVIWTVADANGCSQTCNQFVTINDLTPPTISCGNAFYAGTSWTNCGYPSSLLEAPTVSDECGIFSVTNDAPAFFEPGMYMPTWTVTDVNGNTASCMQWVTINDTTNPKITSCPSDINVPAQTATGATVTWALPTGMDNCPGDLLLVSTHNPGDFFPLGTTTVTYTVYDQGGNSEVCSFFVTVSPIMPLVGNNTGNTTTGFELFQNKPNPFSDQTTIVFNLPNDDFAMLTIYDTAGRILKKMDGQFSQGRNEIKINRADILGSGIFFYELRTATNRGIDKMILE